MMSANYNKSFYQNRRKAVQQKLPPDSVLLVFGGQAPLKSNDVHYVFRPDSDFYYLTGFYEEECVLYLTNDLCTLYMLPKDPEKETWNGIRLGVENAVEVLGVDKAADTSKFAADLPGLLKNRKHLFHFYGRSSERDALLFTAAGGALRRARMGEFGPTSVLHPSTILHEMRMIKSPEEIRSLEECGSITAKAHIDLMRMTRPGMHEYELHAALLYEFRRNDATEGYPSIVASGQNSCILHYTENNNKIGPGDLVLVDAGCEKYCVNADVTRTFPASGKFSPAQCDVYQLVLSAQKKAFAASVIGASIESVHETAVKVLVQGLIDIGLLRGSMDENMTDDPVTKKPAPYKKFYMHKTGHWLGMDVHDVGAYFVEGAPRKFTEGVVCTVEPGLYIPSDDSVPVEFRGIGIRIEDDVLITPAGARVLTDGAPKEVEQIEALMAAARAA